MTEEFSKELLRKCVGQICQVIGWTSIQSTPLEVLTDLSVEFIKTLGRKSHDYAELYNQTDPNLDHMELAFKDMDISITGLTDYVKNFEHPASIDVPKFPIAQNSHLNFLKPGSREVLTRPVHIHEHLPPMHPHLEDVNYAMKQSPGSVDGDNTSPLASPKTSVFKRPGDPIMDGGFPKRFRSMMDEEVRPLREISSVMMTTSGFLSPAREGKLPEARTPIMPSLETIGSSVDYLDNIIHSENKDRKRKRHLNDGNLGKKAEKENKTKDDNSDYEPKSKKACIKEPNKVKILKPGTFKTVSQQSLSPNISSNKSLKQNIQKFKQNVTMDMVLTKPIKASHFVSVKNDNTTVTYDPNQSDNLGFSPAEKLPSEPDKQKLNIFRKISKLKEEIVEVFNIKKELEEPDYSQWTPVDQTIESVIQESKISLKEENEIKEEHIDVERIDSPPQFDTSPYPDDQSFPDTPTTPRTPDLPWVIEHKKKKKDKHKEKRDSKDKYNNSPKICSKYISDPEFCNSNLAKPKTPEVDLTSEEVIPSPIFSFFPPFPGLIPSHTMLFQHLPIPKAKTSIPSDIPANNIISDISLLELGQCSSHNSTNVVNPVISQMSTQKGTGISDGAPVSKKKEHKKEKKLKEKIKKKKEKKAKSKEKSEKKKIKLEKKEREKEKSKLKKEKKEKKKEKEINEENIEGQCGGLPKITLKFGPLSPQDPQESGVRKIVIKPLLKKEEETLMKIDRPPSPELAKISPLVPRLSKHKSRTHSSGLVEEFGRPTPFQSTVLPNEKSEIPVAVRVDNDGNKVWICPACGRQDDGSPMIGCDGCDAWYHWVCVGIQVPPASSEWFCRLCVSRKTQDANDKKKKNRKKKPPH